MPFGVALFEVEVAATVTQQIGYQLLFQFLAGRPFAQLLAYLLPAFFLYLLFLPIVAHHLSALVAVCYRYASAFHFSDDQLLVAVEHACATAGEFGACYTVGYGGYGADDVGDDFGPAHGVVFNLVEQKSSFESDEVYLVGDDVVVQLGGRVATGERVGVFSVGQAHATDVEPLGEYHVDASERGLYAGCVAVVYDGYVFGESRNQLYLFRG